METPQHHWITSVIFEHACKQNLKSVTKRILEDSDLTSKVMLNSVNSKPQVEETPKVQPVYLFISLLKKMHSLENFAFKPENSPSISVLAVLLDLLESTYKQFNFMTLKRYFTLTSELRLLDLLNLIVNDSESSLVVHKLNQHFPRWTPSYRLTIEKDFKVENSKVLDKVEESHTKCRRLILKLAVDKTHKAKYMSDEYPADLERFTRESKEYILEVITSLELHTGPSVLEKISSGEDTDFSKIDDLGVQLLLDYIQPKITSEALLKYLDDLEPILNSQPTSALTSCLLPLFDTMSEVSDDSEKSSDSEYESSEDVADSVKSFTEAAPVISDKTSDVEMDSENDD